MFNLYFKKLYVLESLSRVYNKVYSFVLFIKKSPQIHYFLLIFHSIFFLNVPTYYLKLLKLNTHSSYRSCQII